MPRSETPGFPSKIRLPSNTNTSYCAKVVTVLFKVIPGITITLSGVPSVSWAFVTCEEL